MGVMGGSRYTLSLRNLSAEQNSRLIPSSVIPNVATPIAVSIFGNGKGSEPVPYVLAA